MDGTIAIPNIVLHQAGFPAKGSPANKAARIPMQIKS
uniref:Uncharacterized protein n=1 Tax=Arundo donax TaxID=35708 RepID=A0A0A9CSF5_ARUDO